ncbi:MAG TPA: hypothetical protein VN652_06685 [Geobacteraceae bacterium]|nr:hypothetical protein [Geobacteraceae bacterium]
MKNEAQKKSSVQRLCSEIQLFDLCDLNGCHLRDGRFCSNEDLLRRFESIKEKDETPDLVYDEDELISDEESDFEEYDEEFEHEDE